MASSTTRKKSRRRASAPEESGDLRRRVIDAALSIIETRGPDAVSMREVARRAGVSHQAPYHHFLDRAGIFAAITAAGYTSFDEQMRRTLETSNEPAIDCLRTYLRFALSHRGHFRIMSRSDLNGATTHPEAAAAAERAFQTLIDLARRVDPSAQNPTDTMILALAIWSNAHGLAMLLIDGPLLRKIDTAMSVDDLVERMGQRFTKSLGIQPLT